MDAQGPNMSKAWNLEFGQKLLGIIRAERNKTMHKTIGNLEELKSFLAGLPGGTTANVRSSDLERGNFETARFEVPRQGTIELDYYGFAEAVAAGEE